MLSFLSFPYNLIAYAVIAVALVGGGFYEGHDICHNAWMAEVAQQKIDAANILADAQAKIAAQEKEYADLKSAVDAEHLVNVTAINDAHRGNADLARELDSMRGQCGRGQSGSGAVPGPAKPAGSPSPTPAPGAVSGSFEELVDLAADADSVAEYARACHQWVGALR